MKQGLMIGILILLSAGMLAGVFLVQSKEYLAQNARAICMQAYRIEYNDEQNSTVVVSVNEIEVKKCIELADK